ncbi:MAG: hypothetical protein ACXWL5_01170 [Candidatus Chromulinivorax sp.]
MKQIKILMIIIFSILSATLNCPPEVNSINFDRINVSAKPDPAKKATLPLTAEKAKMIELSNEQLLQTKTTLIDTKNQTPKELAIKSIENTPSFDLTQKATPQSEFLQADQLMQKEYQPWMANNTVQDYVDAITNSDQFTNKDPLVIRRYINEYFKTNQPTISTGWFSSQPRKIEPTELLSKPSSNDSGALKNLYQQLNSSYTKPTVDWNIPTLNKIQETITITKEALQPVVDKTTSFATDLHDAIINRTEYAKNNAEAESTPSLIDPALNVIGTGVTTVKNAINSTKNFINKSTESSAPNSEYSYQFTQETSPKTENPAPLLLTYTPEWHVRDITADGTKTDLMKKQELDTLFGENKLSDMKNFEKINVSEKNAPDHNNLANENQPFTPEIQTALKTSTIPTLTKSTVGNFMYTACRKTARSIRNTPQAVKQFINKFITTLSYMLNLTKEETLSLQSKAELEANKLIADKQSWLYAKQDFDIKFAEWTNNMIDSFNRTIGRKNKSSSMQMISIDTQRNNVAAPKLNLVTDGDMVTSAQIIYKGHSYFVDPANITGPDITGSYSITTDLVKEPKSYNPLEKTYQFAYNLVQGSIFHSLKESPAGNKAEQTAPEALDKVQEFITPNGQPSEGKLMIEFNNQYKTLKTEIRQPQENAIIAINTTHDLKGKSKPITSITIADNHTNTFTPTVSFDINANNGQIIDNPSVSHTITNTQGIKTTIRATSNTIRQLQDGRYIIESTFTYPEKPKLTYTQQFMQSIFSQTPKLLNDIITNIREGYTLTQVENKVADTIGRDKISEQINDVITYLFSANETQIEKVMTSYDPVTNKITTWVTNQMSDGTSKMVTTNYTLFDQTKSSTNNQTTPTIPTKSNFILQQPRKLQNEKSLL